MLKSVMFQSPRGFWPVVYLMTEDRCIFTAVSRNPSAINCVEEIIEAICAQEHRATRSLKFFELNTRLGYASKNDGEFEYDEVIKTGRPAPENRYIWNHAECPADIIETFRYYISRSGAEPRQIICASVAAHDNGWGLPDDDTADFI